MKRRRRTQQTRERKEELERITSDRLKHNVQRYWSGCRCEVCRAAQAAYNRNRARELKELFQSEEAEQLKAREVVVEIRPYQPRLKALAPVEPVELGKFVRQPCGEIRRRWVA